MQRERKCGRMTIGYPLSEEFKEFELFLLTIPERKKAQAVLELYLYCKEKMGIDEVRSRIIPADNMYFKTSAKFMGYEENYKKYAGKYMTESKTYNRKKQCQKKTEALKAEEEELRQKETVDIEPDQDVPVENEAPDPENIEEQVIRKAVLEDAGGKTEQDTVSEGDEEYMPDMEALKEFF